MKIGILTFHSQLNYGGVLQCWALQTALEKMGHEVVVIDRLLIVQLRSVMAVFSGWTLRMWLRFIKGILLRRPYELRILRHIRTVRFAQQYLHLTDYSFREWSEAPKDLGVDMIVVGSDQVWNPTWSYTGFYMLEGAPDIPAIGYAISLGVTQIPEERVDRFIAAKDRFLSISAREKSAANLLNRFFNDVQHVVDPVLLVGKEVKESVIKKSGHRHFVGYFINEVLDGFLAQFQSIAINNDLTLHLLVDGRYNQPKRISGHSRIKFHLAAGPIDFIQLIASSDGVFTDSFHAVMYAYKFKRPLAVLRPHEGDRLKMFDRIKEFIVKHGNSDVLRDNVVDLVEELLVQQSCWNESVDDMSVSMSLRWLKDSLL